MTNMFKRSLVALAIAGASTGAMAADVTLTETTYATNEFMSTMDKVLSKNVVITLNDEYKVGDYIYLRFQGDAYLSGAPNQTNVVFGEQFDETASPAPGPVPGNAQTPDDDVNKGISLDYVAQTTDSLGNIVHIYRVNNIYGDADQNTNDTTYGVEIDFGRFNFDAEKVVAQNGVIFDTFSRLDYQPWPETTTAYDFDTVTSPMIDATQLFFMEDQYELVVDVPYSGELDVWDHRRQFRIPGETYGQLTEFSAGDFHVATRQPSPAGVTAWDYEVEVDTNAAYQVRYTLSGDNMFGWIESADPQVGNEINFGTNTANCTYVSHTASELVFDCDDADVAVNLEFDLQGTNPDSGQNPKQDGEFSLSAKVNWHNYDLKYQPGAPYEDGVLNTDPTGTTNLGPEAAGEWTVNGSITHIPYMPYAAQSAAGQATPIGQIIYVTNTTRDPGFDDVLVCNDPGDPLVDDCNGEGDTPNNLDIERAIWVEGIDENGNTFGPVKLPVFADPGVTGISGHIRNALLDANMLTNGARMSLTVTVADYPTNISVYSAYNVNGSDRGWVQNDSIRTDIDLYKGNGIID